MYKRRRLLFQVRVFKLLSFLFLLVSAISLPAALAQEADTGAYGSVGLEVSRFDEELGVLISFAGGYRLNGYSVGVKLYDLLNGPSFPDGSEATQDLHLKLHLLGLEIGWTGGQKGQWRPAAAMLIGGGDTSGYEDLKRDATGQSWFFVLQPTLSLEAPLQWVVMPRLDLGWRYIVGSRTPGISDEELGGPSLGLSVRFPN